MHWIAREKISISEKRIAVFDNTVVDAELLQALMLLKQNGIVTEFSCAGVSPLDEVEDHSLYAYITLIKNENSHAFIQAAMKRMKHRILVSYEPGRNRYDISSFFLGHNRTFCRLIQACAEEFELKVISK